MQTPPDQPQDAVGADDHDLTVVYEPSGVEESPAARRELAGAFRYALVVERGPRAGLTYVLGEGETGVGRADDVEIFLSDVTVSRHHARFVVDADGLRVMDLGSTNGTYVNGERHDEALLQPGDEVIIGKFHLIVAGGNA
jgi:pSer/pThr/pTyr-binding forkhead associated (FHA) protein